MEYQAQQAPHKFETHEEFVESDQEALFHARKDLENRGLSHLIPLVEQLKESLLFMHILKNKGLSGEGIDLVFQILENQPDKTSSPLSTPDEPLLAMPIVKATQERFHLFQQELSSLLEFYDKDKTVRICSVPCGFMRDLFSFQTQRDLLEIVGIDKDAASLLVAKEKFNKFSSYQPKFFEADAFDLSEFKDFDIVLSNGFNFYLDDAKVKSFNYQLSNIIKPGGYLIISHITPMAEWDFEKMDPEALKLEKQILFEITQAKFMPHVRPAPKVVEDLEVFGFRLIKTLYDEAKRFPTFVLQRD